MLKPKPSILYFGALLFLACSQPAKEVTGTKPEEAPQTSVAPAASTHSVQPTPNRSILLQGRVFYMPDGSQTPPVVPIATNDLWALTLAQHVGSRKIADFLFLVRANQATVLPDCTRAEVLEYVEYPSWIIVRIRILEGDLAGQTLFTFPEFLPTTSLAPDSLSGSPARRQPSKTSSETPGKIANRPLRDPIYDKREAYMRRWYSEKYLPALLPVKSALRDIDLAGKSNDENALATACTLLNSATAKTTNLETNNFVLNKHLQSLLEALRATGSACRRGDMAELSEAEGRINRAMANLELCLRPFDLKP